MMELGNVGAFTSYTAIRPFSSCKPQAGMYVETSIVIYVMRLRRGLAVLLSI